MTQHSPRAKIFFFFFFVTSFSAPRLFKLTILLLVVNYSLHDRGNWLYTFDVAHMILCHGFCHVILSLVFLLFFFQVRVTVWWRCGGMAQCIAEYLFLITSGARSVPTAASQSLMRWVIVDIFLPSVLQPYTLLTCSSLKTLFTPLPACWVRQRES